VGHSWHSGGDEPRGPCARVSPRLHAVLIEILLEGEKNKMRVAGGKGSGKREGKWKRSLLLQCVNISQLNENLIFKIKTKN
jgi:hypothetical protein